MERIPVLTEMVERQKLNSGRLENFSEVRCGKLFVTKEKKFFSRDRR